MNTTPIVSLEIGKKVAVLYSVEQKCFHLESVKDYITNHVKHCLIQSECNDYRLICICNTDIEGDAFIKEFRGKQE